MFALLVINRCKDVFPNAIALRDGGKTRFVIPSDELVNPKEVIKKIEADANRKRN